MKNLSYYCILLVIMVLSGCSENDCVLVEDVSVDLNEEVAPSRVISNAIRPLTEDEKIAIKEIFPSLNVDIVVIYLPYADEFNCIAYAMGFEDRWINPELDIEDFKKQFEDAQGLYGSSLPKLYGFRYIGGYPGSDGSILDGWGVTDSYMTHASRLVNGTWMSKLGAGALISHNRGGLESTVYGKIRICFKNTPSRISEIYSKLDTTTVKLVSLEQQIIKKNSQKVKSDIRDKFERLHEEWYDASRKDPHILMSSSIYTRMELPQFKEMLDMGDEIIPLVLEKMMDRKYFFTQALYEALMEKEALSIGPKSDVLRGAQDKAQLLVRQWIELYGS